MINIEKANIAVIGLGYVGLPLCVELGKKYKTLGLKNKVHVRICLQLQIMRTLL